MIKVSGVSKTFGKFKALDNVSMKVTRGTIYGLVGPNGAGKTTILNHISGALIPDSGEITVGDERVFENAVAKQKILSITDNWFYYGTYTVRDMAEFYRSMYPSWNRERYESMKALFDIEENRQIGTLSKGMKKQVAFWLSLSAMPEVLVLDEPLDGLDPVMRKQVLNLCIADVTDRGMTIVVSSHNLRELEDICDWVGIIHSGRMLLEKELSDLKGNIHKYQLVLNEENAALLRADSSILHISNTGSVYSVIVRGSEGEYNEKFGKLSPALCERISLTLEEVFIYELGGMGYDIKSIVV